MAGAPRQAIANIPRVVSESMVKPAVDQVGQAIEQGVSDVFGTPVKPVQQNTQKPLPLDPSKKAEEDRRKQNILRYFDSLKANAVSYKVQQEAEAQKKLQEEMEERQKVRQFQFVKEQKKKESINVYRAQRQAEIKVKGG